MWFRITPHVVPYDEECITQHMLEGTDLGSALDPWQTTKHTFPPAREVIGLSKTGSVSS